MLNNFEKFSFPSIEKRWKKKKRDKRHTKKKEKKKRKKKKKKEKKKKGKKRKKRKKSERKAGRQTNTHIPISDREAQTYRQTDLQTNTKTELQL